MACNRSPAELATNRQQSFALGTVCADWAGPVWLSHRWTLGIERINIMEDIAIQLGITLVLNAIKNPAKKKALRKAMLKIFNAIKMAYPGDPDFS
jgi:hypothetical protein